MLFDLMTLVLAPLLWIAGYAAYGAHRPATRIRRRWLLAAAVLAIVACSSSIVGLTAGPTGVVGAAFDYAGGVSLLAELAWFFLATRRTTARAA